jgi:hypothetical protein
MGGYQEAVDDLEAGLRLKPGDPDALRMLEEARIALRQAKPPVPVAPSAPVPAVAPPAPAPAVAPSAPAPAVAPSAPVPAVTPSAPVPAVAPPAPPLPPPAALSPPAPPAPPAPPPAALSPPARKPASTSAAATRLFAVQVGAFADRRRAEQLRAKWEALHGSARLVERPGQPPLWRVLVGLEPSSAKADALARRLRAEIPSAMVVPLSDPTPRGGVGREKPARDKHTP